MDVTSIVVLFLRGVLRNRTELACRKPRAAPATCDSPAEVEMPTAPAARPDLLGVALSNLGRLAICLAYRATQHRGAMASSGIQAFLAIEVVGETRTTENQG